jgi:hypothetical protein
MYFRKVLHVWWHSVLSLNSYADLTALLYLLWVSQHSLNSQINMCDKLSSYQFKFELHWVIQCLVSVEVNVSYLSLQQNIRGVKVKVKIKVKFLCLTKYHTTELYPLLNWEQCHEGKGGRAGIIHKFLTSVTNVVSGQFIHWVPGALSPGIMLPEREADHSHPSSAEVKSAWSYTFTPPMCLLSMVLS